MVHDHDHHHGGHYDHGSHHHHHHHDGGRHHRHHHDGGHHHHHHDHLEQQPSAPVPAPGFPVTYTSLPVAMPLLEPRPDSSEHESQGLVMCMACLILLVVVILLYVFG